MKLLDDFHLCWKNNFLKNQYGKTSDFFLRKIRFPDSQSENDIRSEIDRGAISNWVDFVYLF